MTDPDKALATQLANIEKRSGKTLAQLAKIVEKSGLVKHGEIVAMLKETLGMGHGDANTLVHTLKKAASGAETAGDPLDALYVGAKAGLRPVHERVLKELLKLGAFEAAPKKTYVSYRRKKQFLTIGPATKTQVEIGFNMKGVAPTERLEALPPGKMCNYRLRLGDPKDVDRDLVAWIRTAWESAG